ncbi:PD40 domain-containing protein [Streptomyces vastus]|uniref:PD40 domain-containing protein n=2 Tax=Streptomyces vastus TaxID=285451 RepID=A0ABN3RY62_9ACTN
MTAVLAATLACLAGPAGAAEAVGDERAPSTERISVAPDGTGGNHHSVEPAVSSDGRVVAFQSSATNLVPGTDVRNSVFYRTAPGAPLQRVVVPGESTSTPQLSESGRHLTFNSFSATTTTSSVHVMDLRTGTIEHLAPAMDEGYHVSYGTAPISASGRYVAFVARPAVDENGAFACRVMLLDRRTQQVQQVSRPSDGSKNFHQCQQISMSADGRKVAYLEGYSGPSDNDQGDILVYDRVTGQTVHADATHDGAPADRSAIAPVLSADGSKVGFNSVATNLVPGSDPNGNTSTAWNAFVRDLRTGTLQRYDGHSPTDLTLVSDLSVNGSKLLLNTADADRRTLGLILRDLRTGQEDLLSPGQDGNPVTVGRAALSADESTAVFDSYYPGLVPDDTNLIGDVFVRTLR